MDSKDRIQLVRRWWFPVRDLTANMLMYAACFALLVGGAVYGTVLMKLASHVITSKFILHLLAFLEYAAVVVDSSFVLMNLFEHLRDSVRRISR